ncbi:chitodextrinase [Allocatelliglobosispora scoriae]|uniref:Chitodextrinase n=1 Tax=Allocatelliglobosispora scoriae TaxID=643052 RepID=A0A841BMS8_9ACTN|nr:fibronectin type III domain-containing protein [Allocatelliglobosispora scoriae]MBB5868130.1 chitodextrinase [Allocatelliglobosispora scoriae]
MKARSRARSVLAAVGAVVLGAALTFVAPAGAQAAAAGPPTRPAAPATPDPALQAHPLTAAAGPVDNPLKGWARFYSPGGDQNNGYPHALTWGYFGLSEIMTSASNCASYNWSIVDSMLAETAGYGNQAAIRIYMTYPGGTGSHPANAIPPCFTGNVATRADATWNVTHPDYDSPFLITALKNFIAAFGARYDGDPRLGFIHLGLVGLWGEWHTWPYDTDTADGLPNYMPTDANGAQLIAAFDAAFNTTKIELRYPEAGGGAANTRDIGYHDDSFCFREGSPLQGVTLPASLGGASYAQLQRNLNTGTENKWIGSSMGGELRPEIQTFAFQSWPNGSGTVDNLKACIELEHATWMINEGSAAYSPTDANVAAATRLMGYNLTVDNAWFKDSATGTTNVGVQVSNSGVAPFYYPWTVSLGLKNGSGTVVRTWDTAWDLRTVKPLTIRNFPDWNVGTDPSYRDFGYRQYFQHSVDLTGLAQGGYQWVLRVKNPLETVSAAAKKLRFANATQNADGWLGLGAMTVGTGSADTTAPSTPTGLTSTGQTSSSVSLSWGASTDNVGVTGYEVFRGSTLVGSPAGTTFTDTGLSASTAYTYTVKARDAAGNRSAASGSLTVTTSAGGGSPVGYEAEASGNTLTGGAVVAACASCSGGSKVGYVGNGATLAFTNIAGGTGGARTVTIHYLSAVARTAIVNGQTVSFAATADWNTVGTTTVTLTLAAGNNTITIANPGDWAPDIDRITVSGGTTGDTTAPTTPTGLTSPGKTSSSISLSWGGSTDNVGVTGYEVFRGSTLVGSPTGTTFTDTGLSASTAYTYTVKARDAAGNRSAASGSLTVTTSAGGGSPVGYEAEASGNTLTGGALVASCASCSGGSKVGYVGNGATLAFNNVAGGTGGARTITIHYLSAVARTAVINGQTVNFAATADWNTVGTTTVTLTLGAGTNTITVANASGWAPDIDRITVS